MKNRECHLDSQLDVLETKERLPLPPGEDEMGKKQKATDNHSLWMTQHKRLHVRTTHHNGTSITDKYEICSISCFGCSGGSAQVVAHFRKRTPL